MNRQHLKKRLFPFDMNHLILLKAPKNDVFAKKRVHFKKHIFLLTARIYAIIKLIFYRLIDKEGKTAVATPSELFFERTKKEAFIIFNPSAIFPL